MKLVGPIAALVLACALSACTSKQKNFGVQSNDGGPPRLHYGAVVPLWDHYCVSIDAITEDGGDKLLGKVLRQASKRGWEMVAASGTFLCFKRPHTAGDES